jgi:ubiquinone/menaquinone biosynthesis C-methylase UbiE
MRNNHYYFLAKEKNHWDEGDLRIVLDFIRRYYETGEIKSILEIGCGAAELLNHIPSEVDYTGLDPTEFRLEENYRQFPNQKFVEGVAEFLPFSAGSFDLVFLAQTLQFFQNPPGALAEIIRVVKSAGYVIILAPNLEWPLARIPGARHYSRVQSLRLTLRRWSDLAARSLGYLSFRVIPQNTMEAIGKFERADDDMKYITSAYEIAQFFQKRGFSIVHAKPVKHQPGIKGRLQTLLNKIPVLQYYQGGMLFIFKKS